MRLRATAVAETPMAEANKPKAPPPPPPPPPAGAGGLTTPPDQGGGAFSGLRVSLMPRDLEGEGKPDLKLRLLALFLVLVLETGGVLVGLYVINQKTQERISERQTLDQQLDAAQTKAAKAEQSMKDALVFQTQLVAVEAALNRHVYTSKIIEFLDQHTLSQVRLTRVQIDVSTGKVGLDVSAQGYRRLAEQIVHLSGLSEVLEIRNASVSAIMEEGHQKATATTALILQLDPSVWLGQTSTPAASDDNQD